MITINIEKAKLIGHDMRRAARAKEFAPHDEIVAKRIPGTSVEEAEAARQSIRDKYSAIQSQIDAAETVDQIKEALGV